LKEKRIFPDRCREKTNNCKSCEFKLFGCADSQYHPKQVRLIEILSIGFAITMLVLAFYWGLFFYDLIHTQLSILVFVSCAIISLLLSLYCINYTSKKIEEIKEEPIKENIETNKEVEVIVKKEVVIVPKCKFYPFTGKKVRKIICDLTNVHPNDCGFLDMHSNCHYEKGSKPVP
jgi:hypothetical protein